MSSVAALAAFGWAGVAKASDLAAPGAVSITVNDDNDGVILDSLTIEWTAIADEDSVVVKVLCGLDPEARNAKWAGAQVDADVLEVEIAISDFNGAKSLKVGDTCIALVKGKHAPGDGRNDNGIGVSVPSTGLVD